jgi:hypothetical protein
MTNVVSTSRVRDRGEVVAQTVIVFPVVLLVLMFGVQYAVWAHAGAVAAAAADRGAATAAARNGSAALGARAARDTVSGLGARLAGTPLATVTTTQASVTVEVTVARLVPMFPTRVRRSAVEPRERFVPELERWR